MFGEAIAVLWRDDIHVRVTRSLRPLFLLDTILLQGVRRYVHMYVRVHTYVRMYCIWDHIKQKLATTAYVFIALKIHGYILAHVRMCTCIKGT